MNIEDGEGGNYIAISYGDIEWKNSMLIALEL
jgi:hypothetical protein